MQNDHFAILVGISRYPNLQDGDLLGPVNDVKSVYEWLTDERGGGLPEANIRKVTSEEFSAPPKKPDGPWLNHLTDELFYWIYDLAEAAYRRNFRRKVGSRLYIYLTGHGCSGLDGKPCLLTANAREGRLDANLGIWNWINWWSDAGCFDEYVMLFDACMERLTMVIPSPAPQDIVPDDTIISSKFVAYAAKKPKKAVERPLPASDGKYHGVFTWALLEGLRGAAANKYGVVTGDILGNWINNAMYHWMSNEDIENNSISLEPDIDTANSTLVLAHQLAPMTYRVELQFPVDAVGKTAIIWSGAEPARETFTAEAVSARDLSIGLHLVECAGYRQGFEVVRPGNVVVFQRGNAIAQTNPNKTFRVFLNAMGTANQISLQNANLAEMARKGGSIDVKVPFGLYRSRTSAGRRFVDQVFMVDGDYIPGDEFAAPPEMPRLSSAIPFHGAPKSYESQSEVVEELGRQTVPRSESHIAILARGWTPADLPGSISEPWKGVRILRGNGHVVSDLTRSGTKAQGDGDGDHDGDRDGSAHTIDDVKPGTYYLNFPATEQSEIAIALTTAPAWRTEAYILRSRTESDHAEALPRVTVIMRRSLQKWDTEENDRLEKSLRALADGRSILNDELTNLLTEKFNNPIEGIVGAHLMLMEWAHVPQFNMPLFELAVTNLRKLLGTDHPDVEALSLKCDNPEMRRTEPFIAPPLFERSWRLMVEASRSQPDLIPERLWKRVSAQVTLPPYFCWSINKNAKARVQKALSNAARTLAPAPRGWHVDLPARLEGLMTSSTSSEFFSDLTVSHTVRENRGAFESLNGKPSRTEAAISSEGSSNREAAEPDNQLPESFAQMYGLPPVAVRSIERTMRKKDRRVPNETKLEN